MKKFIQFISFVFIAVVFSVVAVSAQTAHKFQAEIPFDFSVGKNIYSAGTYNVRVDKSTGTVGVLTLSDKDGKMLDRVAVSSNGMVSEKDSFFTFVRTGNQRSLSKISSAAAGFDVPWSNRKQKSMIAGSSPAEKITVPTSSL